MNIHIYNYLKHNIRHKTKIQLHILITCHLYASSIFFKCHIILEFLLSSTIMLFVVTADGFQNGCQELGSKYNMNWMLA
jgi:hypothetical protein